MYERLLLSAGGGIIDRMQQAAQDNCATICIGLGGTGIDCLRSVKRAVYNRLQPDDPDAAVPQYSHIRFIAVDTDLVEMMKRFDRARREGTDGLHGEIDVDREFFDISYADKISELFRGHRNMWVKDPAFKEWLQFRHIEVGAADSGRQIGRFLLMQRAQSFISYVQRAVRSAKNGLGDCPVYVHIFSGLSGGSGSGIFLDACYLVQWALCNMGRLNTLTLGYFFLPDVNLFKPGIPQDIRSEIRKNGYAAMQELDYCMNFENNGDSWHQVYPGVGEIRTKRQPVDLCHLISAPTLDGEKVLSPYRCAINTVTDYVTNMLIKPDSYYLPLASAVARKFAISAATGDISRHDYIALSAASAVIPYKQAFTYLASKVFEDLAEVKDHAPTHDDVETFLNGIGFIFDDLLKRLTQNVNMSFPLPDFKAKDVKESGTELLIGPLHDLQAAAEGALARNYAALAQPLSSYEQVWVKPGSRDASVMRLVLNAVRAEMVNPKRGPYYAAQLVFGSRGCDLLAAAEGIRVEAMTRRDHEQEQIDSHAYRDYEQKEREFRIAGFLKLKGAYAAYADASRQLVVLQTRVKMYQTLIDLMDAVKDQLRTMMNNFTIPFTMTVSALLDTFAANRAELEADAERENPYEIPLIPLPELMKQMDELLSDERKWQDSILRHKRDLLELLLSPDGLKGWGPNGDEVRLSHLVSDYFVNRFKDLSSRSLDSFLKDKYQAVNPIRLQQRVCDELLRKVNDRAVPLFWTEIGYDADDVASIGYLTVPQISPTAIDAGARFINDQRHELTLRTAGVRDRISILRCWIGVPMWAYAGVVEYESEAVRDSSVGRHIYEPAERVDGVPEIMDSRDWRKLPSPTPPSMMTDRNDESVRRHAEEVRALFKQARDSGVIAKLVVDTTKVYGIRVIADEFMQRFREQFAVANGPFDDRSARARDNVMKMSANREYEKSTPVLSSAFRADERAELSICLDNLAKAPVLQKIVRNELAKVKEIDDACKALEFKNNADVNEFSDALFSGVIQVQGPKVWYADPDSGKEVVLSAKGMKPYGYAPLYQAYGNFKGLDVNVRERIRDAVNEVLGRDELPESVMSACRVIPGELDRADRSLKAATSLFPDIPDEAFAVVRVLREKYDLFLLQNFITV
ncbi:tubulin-like doman-containing protein [Bifidobacterium callimiconis]|uniref:Tubulin like n=1 Tax=Bifidobacterium callimiconis TaxID=2306973 RepID=A0A430FC15_9BIFI|nr:tubulin-like doman-containing protein [Bifidobacterium callimiconis]RSX50373.1 Tubulin like [Bifidobacterium callimiconis]